MKTVDITAVCLAAIFFACVGCAEDNTEERVVGIKEVARYQSENDSSIGSASVHAPSVGGSSSMPSETGSSTPANSGLNEPTDDGVDAGSKPSTEPEPSPKTDDQVAAGGRSSTDDGRVAETALVSTGGSTSQETVPAPTAGSTSTGDTTGADAIGDAGAPEETTALAVSKPTSHLVVTPDTESQVTSDIVTPFEDTGDALSLGKEMTRYVVTNDGLVSDRLGRLVIEQPFPSGTMEDCSRVLMTVDGQVCSEAFVSVYPRSVTTDLSSAACNQKRIEPNGKVSVALFCQVASPVSRWDAQEHSPKSGDLFGLKIKHLSAASGVLGRVPRHSIPYMVLRKSVPVITVMNTGNAIAHSDESNLFMFRVNAKGEGDVALKQVVFTIETGTGVRSLERFKLYRDAVEMTSESMQVVSYNGKVLRIMFTDGQEEMITALGHQYTLSTYPSLRMPGDVTVTTQTKIREELSSSSIATAAFDSLSGRLTRMSEQDSSFVWSDLSTSGSPRATRREWTNGLLISDLKTSAFNWYGY